MSDTDLPLQQVPAVVKYSNQRPATGNGQPLPPSVKKANPPDATLAAKIAVAASVTAVVVEAVGGVEAIEEGVNTFMEGSQVLMNALGEVAKLHPFSMHHHFRRSLHTDSSFSWRYFSLCFLVPETQNLIILTPQLPS
jgi:hypothetical protein